MDIMEFEKEFGTEQQCLAYLYKLRWPDGYRCPRCKGEEAWQTGDAKGKYKCRSCGYQTTVISGTIFHDTRKPLTLWFRAVWYATSQKNGTSALGLQRVLGLGSYRTAWTWLHKLRRAMIRPGRDKLQGVVEVDETFIGAPAKGGKRGRGAEGKVLAAVAVEVNGGRVGRVRMGVIGDASSRSLHRFVESAVEKGSTVVTDGWKGYGGLVSKGYRQETKAKKATGEESLLPHVHTVASLLKRWLLGTLQGSCSQEHMAYYLDEYSFRFNRRKSKSRGMLFYRLLQNAMHLPPTTYHAIVKKGTMSCA